jgi:hypothetical protein
MLSATNDIEIGQAFLDRLAWTPRSTIAETKSSKTRALERVKALYAGTKLSLQRQIDCLLLHRVGIRLLIDNWREATNNVGWMYVIR